MAKLELESSDGVLILEISLDALLLEEVYVFTPFLSINTTYPFKWGDVMHDPYNSGYRL